MPSGRQCRLTSQITLAGSIGKDRQLEIRASLGSGSPEHFLSDATVERINAINNTLREELGSLKGCAPPSERMVASATLLANEIFDKCATDDGITLRAYLNSVLALCANEPLIVTCSGPMEHLLLDVLPFDKGSYFGDVAQSLNVFIRKRRGLPLPSAPVTTPARVLLIVNRVDDLFRDELREIQRILGFIASIEVLPADGVDVTTIRLEDVNARLAADETLIFHFMCHGEPDDFDELQLVLGPRTKILSSRLVYRRQAGFYFFNMCHAANPFRLDGLSLMRDWASRTAGAAIGPACAVDNVLAQKLATAFYTTIKSGPPPSTATHALWQARRTLKAEHLYQQVHAYKLYGDSDFQVKLA